MPPRWNANGLDCPLATSAHNKPWGHYGVEGVRLPLLSTGRAAEGHRRSLTGVCLRFEQRLCVIERHGRQKGPVMLIRIVSVTLLNHDRTILGQQTTVVNQGSAFLA